VAAVSTHATPDERHLQWRRQWRSDRCGLARKGGSTMRAPGSRPRRCERGAACRSGVVAVDGFGNGDGKVESIVF
jgi:hypothetical protein